MKRIFSVLLIFVFLCLGVSALSACGETQEPTPPQPKANFKVLSYVVARNAAKSNFDTSHFGQLTDIILFDAATFNTSGEVVEDEKFQASLDHIRAAMKTDGSQKLYINLLGPKSQKTNRDEKRREMSDWHNQAFDSGKLEDNIKAFLTKYNFDGVFFDYEFPAAESDWEKYSEFLVKLDATLGSEFVLGAALSYWDSDVTEEAKNVLDLVALMSYDNFDDVTHYHSSLNHAKKDVSRMLNNKKFDRAKLLLGVPFYGIPIDGDIDWYDYASYYDKLDENGLYKDEDRNLTFSFNTYDIIYDKTKYAIDEQLAGMMVWHYACDLPASNSLSLFNAISQSITDNLK